MQRLLELLYKYKRFFLFAILEFICFLFIVKNNSYQSAAYYSSSNVVFGSVMNTTNSITGYFSLSSENDVLAEENAGLRLELEKLKNKVTTVELQKLPEPDTDFVFIPAKVVNNSIQREDNFMTLNRGKNHGIEVGMGVMSANGVIGKVVSTSGNYSSVMSLLHTKNRVSASVKKSHIIGTVQWDANNPQHANFKFVPRHETVLQGDTIVTSGYNSIFPEGIEIGVVTSMMPDPSAPFLDIRVKFSNDYNALDYVYVVENKTKSERKELENKDNEQ